MVKKLLVCGLGIALSGCFQPMKPSVGHMQDTATGPSAATIPPPVQVVPDPPKPKPTPRVETYSVVVNNVNVRELLFALARDAKINVDIHPGITGAVTLNAIDQTLPQLLTRISKQVDMRYELSGPNLLVMPDSPYLRIYKIDYVNMERSTQGQVSVSSEIVGQQTGGAGGAGGGSAASGGGGAGQNTSRTSVQNRSANRFWDTLTKNVEEILRETDKLLPGTAPAAPVAAAPPLGAPGQQPGAGGAPGAGGGAAGGVTVAALGAGPNVTFREASSVISNPEASILTVRATLRQHDKLQEFLDQVLVNAKRQVLIEVTIVDVQLNNNYQQGINFEVLRTGAAGISGGILPLGQGAPSLSPPGNFLTLAYTSASFVGALRLLETFGNVRVLSSPRISAINNQTALLKVVENVVYFNISSQISQGTVNTGNLQSFSAVPQTVPVGVVLNITPQISDADSILLNVKPTISRISSFAVDPTPGLSVPNRIPQIVIREMESVIKLSSGQMAVMGGLIQDALTDEQASIPWINRIPFLGDALSNRAIQNAKTELVIFLRPLVIRDPSLEGDYRAYRVFAPGDDFMSQPHPSKRPCDFRIDAGCPQ